MKKAVLTMLLAGVTVLGATQNRVNTLGGNANLFFDDEVTAWFFPSLVGNFTGDHVLELGTYAGLQNGHAYYAGFFTGAGLGQALYLNTPVYADPVLNMSLRGLRYALAYGMNSMTLGLALDFATYKLQNKDANGNLTTDNAATFFALTPSLSMPFGEGAGLDAAFNVALPSSKQDTSLTFDGGAQLAFNARYYKDFSENYRGVLFLGFNKADSSTKLANGDRNISRTTAFSLGFGANVTPVENALFLYALTLSNFSSERGTQIGGNTTLDKNKGTSLSLLVALEARLFKFIVARVFAQKLLMSTTTFEPAGGGSTTIGDLNGLLMGLGLGANFGRFMFDAEIAPDLLYNGLYYFTGVPSAFVGNLSVKYSFGAK